MPKQTEMEIPLIEVICTLGGQGTPQQIYPLMTKKFPSLTKEDLEETMLSGYNKWTNRIQWVRQHLIDKGELVSPQRGIWAITEKGKMRIDKLVEEIPSFAQLNMDELYDNYEEDFCSHLLNKLYELSPIEFEEFSRRFLQSYGFVDVNVTEVGPDGGIDGYGRLKIGLASLNVAFQCKRWQGNIGRKEVQQFRGAIQGKYEQGIFFTTSNFTNTATEISFQQGAVPIVLMNGKSIVKTMVEKGFGVDKKPLYLYYEKINNVLYD